MGVGNQTLVRDKWKNRAKTRKMLKIEQKAFKNYVLEQIFIHFLNFAPFPSQNS